MKIVNSSRCCKFFLVNINLKSLTKVGKTILTGTSQKTCLSLKLIKLRGVSLTKKNLKKKIHNYKLSSIKLILLYYILLFNGLFHSVICKAQDTTKLNEIEVVSIKQTQNLNKTIIIDSSAYFNNQHKSIGEILANYSTIFIKNYGNGAIGTTSFRGGNANQTAILWEGINIKNTMLGQTDLSLIPSVLFNNISINYGGSSGLWGSDAVGGSVQLSSKNTLSKNGYILNSSLSTNSIKGLNATTGFETKNNKWYSNTKIYLTQTKNKYNYIDTMVSKNPITVSHAAYSNIGILQNLKFTINRFQKVGINIWLNQNDRQIPNYNPLFTSKQYLFDRNLKSLLQHNFQKNKFLSNTKLAFIRDVLNYTDSSSQIFSNSLVNNLILDNETKYIISEKLSLQSGYNISNSKANTKNYINNAQLNKLGIYGMLTYNMFRKITLAIVSRYEASNYTKIPITGNLNLNIQPITNFNLKLNAAKVFRQPTLNEMFWYPGGNPNLLPENGYSYDGEISYQLNNTNFNFYSSLAAYYKTINNWILWLPGENGNPTPKNIQQVISKGTETTFKLSYKLNNIKIGLQLLTHYCLSTIQQQKQEFNNSINKQLIYTPRYTGNLNGFIIIKNLSLYITNQYVGYRFTSSDNSTWLNPYYVSSIKLNYLLNNKNNTLINLFICAQNAFNYNYQIVENRPMPLRYFEIGINLNFNKSKQ